MLPSGVVIYILCHSMLGGCDLPFYFDFTGGYSEEIAVSLRRDSERLNIVETVVDYGDFGSWTECIFCILIWLQAYRGQRVECEGFHKNGPQGLIYLNA